jgi:hypothetical protein
VGTLPIFRVILIFGLSWLLRVLIQFSLDQGVVGLVDIVIILHLLGKDIDVVTSDQPGEVFTVLKDVTEGIPKVKKQDHFLVIGRICKVLATHIHSAFQDVDGIFLGRVDEIAT